MKILASLLSGVACAVALFVVMHELIDDSPRFIDPIVEVFELPVDRAPGLRPAPRQHEKRRAGPSQLVQGPDGCRSASGEARAEGISCPERLAP